MVNLNLNTGESVLNADNVAAFEFTRNGLGEVSLRAEAPRADLTEIVLGEVERG